MPPVHFLEAQSDSVGGPGVREIWLEWEHVWQIACMRVWIFEHTIKHAAMPDEYHRLLLARSMWSKGQRGHC